MRYKQKNKIVEAWEYNHDLDISQFGGKITHCVGTHGHMMTRMGEIKINEGEFLVKRGIYFHIMTAEEFNNIYEVINE